MSIISYVKYTRYMHVLASGFGSITVIAVNNYRYIMFSCSTRPTRRQFCIPKNTRIPFRKTIMQPVWLLCTFSYYFRCIIICKNKNTTQSRMSWRRFNIIILYAVELNKMWRGPKNCYYCLLLKTCIIWLFFFVTDKVISKDALEFAKMKYWNFTDKYKSISSLCKTDTPVDLMIIISRLSIMV